MTLLRHRHAGTRGMTLVELLVTMAVTAIVLAGVVQSLGAFQRIHVMQAHQREASEQARLALATIERDLRLAGYGMEAGMALDFSLFRGTNTTSNAHFPCHNTQGTFTGNACLDPANPDARDKQNGPDTLVFYYRNPAYWGGDTAGEPEGKAWSLISAGAGSITITKHGATAPARGELIPRGQILQIVCSGADKSAYVTVGTTINDASGGDGTPRVIPLMTTPPAPGDPFRHEASLPTAPACLRASSARVFMIDRFKYSVANLQLPDGTSAPFLVLDTGTDRNANGVLDTGDLVPVARGVVDLQVAYVRPEAGMANRDAMVGATPGTALAYCPVTAPGAAWKIATLTTPETCLNGLGILDFAQIFTTLGAANAYSGLSYVSALRRSAGRLSEHAGNISAVRVAVVARSQSELTAVSDFLSTQPSLLNRAPNAPDTAPYVYSVADTVIPVRDVFGSRMLSYL